MLLRTTLAGGVWNCFLLSKANNEDIRCRFCHAPDNDGHLFWDCCFPPCVELRNSPEFLSFLKRDRTCWPRCLLRHGWLPELTSRSIGKPWAVAAGDLATHNLEQAFGRYSISNHSTWSPFWDQEDAQNMVDDLADHPNIWKDGSREPIPHLDVEIAGAGAFSHSTAMIFDSIRLGHAQDLDGRFEGSSNLLWDSLSSAICTES